MKTEAIRSCIQAQHGREGYAEARQELDALLERVAELEKWYFLVAGIVKAAKQVLAKQNPQPRMVDKGLAWEEWKLYIAIEEYEKVSGV